jgi:calcineurin-like phosphoesterase family protein
LYGHSHGKLPPIGKSWDIGVDNNDFSPISFKEMEKIMEERPDNPNLVKWRN